MVEWETFDFLEPLLDGFDGALLRARSAVQEPTLPFQVAIAVEGFQLLQPASAWSVEHTAFIQHRLDAELSDEALSWYEEDTPAVATFSCFVLGALLGMFVKGDIDDDGFLLGEAHLPGFVLLNQERICSLYKGK